MREGNWGAVIYLSSIRDHKEKLVYRDFWRRGVRFVTSWQTYRWTLLLNGLQYKVLSIPFCVNFSSYVTQKNTKMIRNAFKYWEAGISKKPKLYFKQFKVDLIFQCYSILTINRICYFNLSPPLFWILWEKKKTNKHLVTTVLYCGQLSQNTWYTMVWFTNVAKAFHCLSIKREIICKM